MKDEDGNLIMAIPNSVDQWDAEIAVTLGTGTGLEHECDDEALMQRVQARQPNAMECLHARYRALVMHVAVGILLDLDDAQEVAQDVFLELWNRAGNFDARRGKLRGWIGALTERRAIDRHRKIRRRTIGHEAFRQRLEWAVLPPWNSENAVFCVEATMADERKILLGILNTLPPEQAQAVLLTYFMEMSQREVAGHLCITLGTVKHRLVLAMSALTRQSAELRAKLSRDR